MTEELEDSKRRRMSEFIHLAKSHFDADELMMLSQAIAASARVMQFEEIHKIQDREEE